MPPVYGPTACGRLAGRGIVAEFFRFDTKDCALMIRGSRATGFSIIRESRTPVPHYFALDNCPVVPSFTSSPDGIDCLDAETKHGFCRVVSLPIDSIDITTMGIPEVPAILQGVKQ